jgi:hypothetical protein
MTRSTPGAKRSWDSRRLTALGEAGRSRAPSRRQASGEKLRTS